MAKGNIWCALGVLPMTQLKFHRHATSLNVSTKQRKHFPGTHSSPHIGSYWQAVSPKIINSFKWRPHDGLGCNVTKARTQPAKKEFSTQTMPNHPEALLSTTALHSHPHGGGKLGNQEEQKVIQGRSMRKNTWAPVVLRAASSNPHNHLEHCNLY